MSSAGVSGTIMLPWLHLTNRHDVGSGCLLTAGLHACGPNTKTLDVELTPDPKEHPV